jgi:hypothetical protein
MARVLRAVSTLYHERPRNVLKLDRIIPLACGPTLLGAVGAMNSNGDGRNTVERVPSFRRTEPATEWVQPVVRGVAEDRNRDIGTLSSPSFVVWSVGRAINRQQLVL